MIIVTVESKIKPEFKQQFIEHMQVLSPIVRAEKGCQVYQLNINSDDENSMLLFEQWDSKADLQAHLATEHMKKHFEEAKIDWFEFVEMDTFEANAFDLSKE